MAVSLSDLLPSGRVAVVMCEIQSGVVGSAAPWPALHEEAERVGLIGNAAKLAAAARTRGAPVIHCTAEDLKDRFGANNNSRLFATAKKVRGGAHHDPALDAPLAEIFEPGDIVLPRFHGVSPMTGSPLDTLLRNEGVTTLILCGVSVSFAILNLTMDAVNRAYQVILPNDAVAGFPRDYAEAVMTNTLSMLATIVPTNAILEAWSV
jgi:nicotinamidase-related amidase